MSLIGFVAVAAVAFVVTVDGGAQPQFYPQQNPFINYYRPEVRPNNNMMNKLNRHRRPVINNNPTVFSDYLAQDQAKIFFGITNFFTSTTTSTSTLTFTTICTKYTATACGRKRSIPDVDDDGDVSQIVMITMEELEATKRKRQAELDDSLGPMYREYDWNGYYNYDDIQSTLGNPYNSNYRGTESPYFYKPYSIPHSDDEEHDEDVGRLFWFWITTTFTTYTTTVSKYTSTPSCSTTSSYGQC